MWLRLVVDEGHSLGKGQSTSVAAMAYRIQADYRWLLTGTPLPTANVVQTLHHLFEVL